LVNLGNENGGKDNITVIAAIIEPKPLQQFFLRMRLFWRKHGKKILTFIFFLAYGFATGILGYYLRGIIKP
jgi:hypothetical protein